MVNDATVRARINSQIKAEATAVLAAIGLTPSDAFRLLMTKVAAERSLPFDPLIPNAETISALKTAKAEDITSFSNLQELMDDLHADDYANKPVQNEITSGKLVADIGQYWTNYCQM